MMKQRVVRRRNRAAKIRRGRRFAVRKQTCGGQQFSGTKHVRACPSRGGSKPGQTAYGNRRGPKAHREAGGKCAMTGRRIADFREHHRFGTQRKKRADGSSPHPRRLQPGRQCPRPPRLPRLASRSAPNPPRYAPTWRLFWGPQVPESRTLSFPPFRTSRAKKAPDLRPRLLPRPKLKSPTSTNPPKPPASAVRQYW